MVRLYVELQGSAAARVPLLVCVLLGSTCVCVWPEPRGGVCVCGTLLSGIETEVPIPALMTASLSSAGPILLRALAVPRDLTGTIQSKPHFSTGTTEGPVL